ncbi:GNAT family N-acetyltransferase [Shewanella sp.]|nr:GNAT family N-acetyltransferase [Shewanella sp.]
MTVNSNINTHASVCDHAGAELRVAYVDNITAIDPLCWDSLMADDNPFNRHAYLAALESSGCVDQQSGWIPHHLVVYERDVIVAVMPLYIKMHSYGEYIFDWAWAEAYDRHQIAYYPKLVSAIPFTPVTGRRVGIAKGIAAAQVWRVINAALNDELAGLGYSSWHCLFLPQQQLVNMSEAAPRDVRCLTRLSTQFHWYNRRYHVFDDFLNALTSRKRKEINKARTKLAVHDLRFEFVAAKDTTPIMWQHFYACYRHTYQKRSGHDGYLNLSFFERIASTMPDNVLLLLVLNSAGEIKGSALYFKSHTHLYGRYWGSLVDIDGLHFEACYYQGIEYCIKHQLEIFDAGAQGEHKVARGFEPTRTYSTHEIFEPAFRSAIADFTVQEANNVSTYMQQLTHKLPYRQQDLTQREPTPDADH